MSYQQYQQAASAAAVPQTQHHYWNGSAWVPHQHQHQNHQNQQQQGIVSAHSNYNSEFSVPQVTHPNSSSVTSLAPSAQQQQQQRQPILVANNKSPVEVYTEYYHGWQAALQEYQQQKQRQTQQQPINGASDLQQRIEWARYYADESSRAAHYYYEQMQQNASLNHPSQYSNIPRPSFDLPPAPPALSVSRTPAIAIAIANNNAGTNPTNTTPADAQTPGSLTQYVQRSLQQCHTPQERAQVQAQVERVIAQAIQQGNLHTKNWSLEPLIAIPGRTIAAAAAAAAAASSTSSSTNMNTGYYGPASSTAAAASSTHPRSYSPSFPNSSPYSSYQPQRHKPATTTASTTAAADLSYYSSAYPQAQAQAQATTNQDFIAFSQTNNNYYANSTHKKRLNRSFQQQQQENPNSSKLSNKKKKQKRKYNDFDNDNGNNSTADDDDADDDGLDRSLHALQKRQARFSGPGGLAESRMRTGATINQDYGKYMGISTIGASSSSSSLVSNNKPLTEEDYERMTVKGTCQVLEKEYLRLTAPPRAELVRPESILKQHLEQLKLEYYSYESHSSSSSGRETMKKKKKTKHDYLWFCSQLKAVRQDLTIQRIQNAFAIDVYETHARIALLEGDLNEFNQCQTQLKELYTTTTSSSTSTTTRQQKEQDVPDHQDEFLAYRLLYHVLLTTNEKYQGGTSEITKLLDQATGAGINADNKYPAMKHALQVRQAVALSDYLKFFRLHQSAPNLGKYLTERMVPTVRFRALKRITRAYRPSLPVSVAVRLLGFHHTSDSDDDDDDTNDSAQQEGREWIQSCGGKLSDDGKIFWTKDCDGAIQEPQPDKKNSLI